MILEYKTLWAKNVLQKEITIVFEVPTFYGL